MTSGIPLSDKAVGIWQAADLPTLGICLGAQLMVRALGAMVYPGPPKEIGWAPLYLGEAGWRSCLAYLGKRETAVLHWHGDTFKLRVGATYLAAGDVEVWQRFAVMCCRA